ncbi:MAG: fluoride efflux transporter CrcB [Rhodospirillaceae bacterium]|nr:fluoride efflux transporter CrcB [Rhodospirillaceae bacterium]
MTWLFVAFGSAVGGALRFWSIQWVDSLAEESSYPWGTLFVNVTGSLLLGVVLGLLSGEHRWTVMEANWRQFLVVGVFGGFTTFSTFSVQTLALIQAGDWGQAALNSVASVVLCVGGAALGWRLGTVVTGAG